MKEKKLSLQMHLKELRRVLVISSASVLVTTIFVYVFFRESVMGIIVDPVRSLGVNLVFTGVSEAFMAYIKTSLWAGMVVASPIILWQILSFILPGLYLNERKRILVMIFLGTVLFITGLLFGYFIVFRFALQTLLIGFSGGFDNFITINNYLGFSLKFLLPFGLVFEIPLVVYVLSLAGIVTDEMMKKNRRYVLVVILIIAAFLTPPDAVSQLMLATPMVFLYEISIWIAKWVNRKKRKNETME